MTASRQPVELLEKNRPRQERAKRTYENILSATAELLVEVGVERISTNLIAERAGITVPALYRYFPNKYAVLHALGAIVMDRQNQVFTEWFAEHGHDANADVLLEGVYDLLKRTHDATLSQTGGIEVVEALRAVAPLQELRLESHRVVSSSLTEMLVELLGLESSDELLLQSRVTVETAYSMVEMALEDRTLAPESCLREGARMVQAYWHELLQEQ